jgi:acetyltransferase-like isoleucine patch superfamily enzyme
VRGVDVGRGSVVGAGAVVTDDLPPFSVAVGVPARPVRSRLPAGMDPDEAADLLSRGLPIPGDPVG